ncbi:Gfo/Idh/MocA family protein [Acidocella aquatica]|uniref:Gfo/Idh/MocA family protein n=1 Tax=Acidocella aquatica TaxID=1922313 RepID=UPI0024E193AD|nr:Gfo/Idh/MocA family oxidoreductase [Acidocella aquatica]
MALRIGVAGANAERGWAQLAHLPAIRALPGLEISAVLNRTQQGADAAAAAFGAAKAYTDIAALVNDPDVGIVAVTVRVLEHRAIVLAALAAGKHVYCEWPLGRDLAEAQEMTEAARDNPVHVAIGTQGPLAPAVRHAAKLVREGAIGRPLKLSVVSGCGGWGALTLPNYVYPEDKRNGATLSTIPDGHTIAAIEAVIGGYAEIDARTTTTRDEVHIYGTNDTVEQLCADHVLVIGRHSSGCVSSQEVVGGTVDTPLCFVLRGTKDTLTITGTHPGGYQCGQLTVATIPAAAPQPESIVPLFVDAPANVAELWGACAADIRNATRIVPNFDAAVRLTRVLDAIDRAAETGRRVILED